MIKVKDNSFSRQLEDIAKIVPRFVKEDIIINPIIKKEVNGFIIERSKDEVTITYQNTNHFFWAIGKLLANINTLNFKYENTKHVNDLGLMLDAARNQVPKIKTLKEYVIYLALFGYNYLEVYVEDVMHVIDEPLFGYMRGRYTIEELKELDDYASDFGIEIIPCIQTLAHLDRLFVHREYALISDIDDILLVGDERTYTLIENILKTTKMAFKSNKINIGMDEAWHLGVGKYLDKNGYEPRSDIMIKHLNKVLELTRKYGYTPSMWADMFFHMISGNYHKLDIDIPKEIKDKIPNDVTLIYWDYYRVDSSGYDKRMKQVKALSSNHSFAGAAWKWIGFAPLNEFTMKAMKPAIEAVIDNDVKDFLVTSWGDNGGEAAHFSILVSLLNISDELSISKLSKEEKDCLWLLLTNYTTDEWLMLDLPNIMKKNVVNPHNPSKYLLYEDLIYGSLKYNTHKGYKSVYKKHTRVLKVLAARDSRFSYLFETLYRLVSVLELKSYLSKEIHKAYLSNDRELMKRYIVDINKIIKRINVFYQVFKKQWLTESKSFGFEIQSYRLGGLVKRLADIKEELSFWVNNVDSSIVALDERIVKEDPKNIEEEMIYYNLFHMYISNSKL